MTKVKKGVTTPQSIKEAAVLVANTVKTAESGTRKQKHSELGKQSKYTFFRIVSIHTTDTQSDENIQYLKVLLREPNPLMSKPKEAHHYVKFDELDSLMVGNTYLKRSVDIDDALDGDTVSFDKIADKYLDQGVIAKTWYCYGLQLRNWYVEEQPTEKYTPVDLVDDDGNVIQHDVYIKKGFSGLRVTE